MPQLIRVGDRVIARQGLTLVHFLDQHEPFLSLETSNDSRLYIHIPQRALTSYTSHTECSREPETWTSVSPYRAAPAVAERARGVHPDATGEEVPGAIRPA